LFLPWQSAHVHQTPLSSHLSRPGGGGPRLLGVLLAPTMARIRVGLLDFDELAALEKKML